MSQITIQEILGTDNVGASRSVMMSNFKLLGDAINKVTSFLDTDPNGGELSIAKIDVKRLPTIPINTEIFTVGASANIKGDLKIGGKVSIIGNNNEIAGLTVTNSFNIGTPDDNDALENKNITRFAKGTSFEDLLLLNTVVVVVDDGSSIIEVKQETNNSLKGLNSIAIGWSTPTASAIIGDGIKNQLLVVTVANTSDLPSPFKLCHNNLDIITITGLTAENFKKTTITLLFNGTNWNVIGCVTPGTITI